MKQSPSPKRHISKTTLKRWQHDTKSTAKTSARRMLAGMQGWGFGDGRRIVVLCADRIVVRARYVVCGQSPLLRVSPTAALTRNVCLPLALTVRARPPFPPISPRLVLYLLLLSPSHYT